MIRKVQGYVSEDGTFFESAAEANLHDTKQVLEGLLLGEFHNVGQIVEFMEANHAEVEAFIKSVQAVRGLEAERELANDPEDDADQADDGGGEEGAAPVLQQPTDSGEHLPDLGRSVSAKEIRDKRKKHGTRSGKAHA